MPQLRSLPIARQATSDAVPPEPGLWGCASPQDEEALRTLANVFGWSVDETAPPLPPPDRTGELVLALHPGLAQRAQRYAQLTGRSASSDMAHLDRATVVIGLQEQLTTRLLESMYGVASGRAPGLIVGRDQSDVDRRILLCSAALAMEQNVHPKRTHFLPTQLLVVSELEGGWAVSAFNDQATRRSALAAGGVVSVWTHSDGIDAMMGPNLTLCPRDANPTVKLDSAPECYATGLCYRVDLELAGTAWSNLVGIGDVRAMVFVMDVCHGFMPAGTIYDQTAGLASHLGSSPCVGAIATPWEMVLSNPVPGTRLAYVVAQGVALGRAVAWHNNSALASNLGHRFCILGDPALTLGPPAAPGVLHEAESRFAKYRPPFVEPYREKDGPIKRWAFWAERLQGRELTDHERDRLAGYPELDPAAQRDFREQALSLFHKTGELGSLWSSELIEPRTWRAITCPRCGGLGTEARGRTRTEERIARQCSLCNMVSDAPTSMDMDIRPSRAGIELVGQPQGAWSAFVFRWAPIKSLWGTWPWPEDADGTPATHFPTHDWPDSVYRARVYVMDEDLSLGVFGYQGRVRGDRLILPQG